MNRRRFFKGLAVLLAAPKVLANLQLPISVVPTAYPLEDCFAAFREATKNLHEQIYARAYSRSIWMGLVPRGTFPSGLGETTRAIKDE